MEECEPTIERHVAPALARIRERGGVLDLVYVSHIDRDHISGVLQLMDDLVAWRVFDYQRESGNQDYPEPESPRPPEVRDLWHNAFHELVTANRGEIERAIAARASVLISARVTRQFELSPSTNANWRPASPKGSNCRGGSAPSNSASRSIATSRQARARPEGGDTHPARRTHRHGDRPVLPRPSYLARRMEHVASQQQGTARAPSRTDGTRRPPARDERFRSTSPSGRARCRRPRGSEQGHDTEPCLADAARRRERPHRPPYRRRALRGGSRGTRGGRSARR